MKMADHNGLLDIPRLNGDNYRDWSSRVKNVLRYKKLWKCIQETKVTDEESDGQAFSVISLSCNNLVKDEIEDCKTAKEAWDLLQKRYVRSTPAAKVALYCDLTNIKCGETSGTKEMVEHFAVIVKKLKELKVTMEDDMYTIILLRALPPAFEQFRVAILTRDSLPELDEVVLKVEEETRRLNQYESAEAPSDLALIARGMNSNKRGCFKCGSTSHIMRYCPKNAYVQRNKPGNAQNRNQAGQYEQYQQRSDNNQESDCRDDHRQRDDYSGSDRRRGDNYTKYSRDDYRQRDDYSGNDRRRSENNSKYALYACVLSTQCIKGQFIIDSGCTSHLCNDREMFTELRPHFEPVKLADGSVITCREIGNVELKLENCIWELNNVLFVPQCSGNFISVSQCVKRGCEIIFKERYVEFIKGRKLIGSGRLIDGLYFLDTFTPFSGGQYVNNINNDKKTLSLMEWHRKLGHLNLRSVERMGNGLVNGLIINNMDKVRCEVCARCKITESTYPKEAQNRSNELLGRIHSDVCEMPSESYGGAKYFVSFIDDYSRFTKVYCIKAKSEVFSCWGNFQKLMEKQTGRRIKVLRSDNGREYCNNIFKNSLDNAGIQHETSVPYSPSQNGVAERMNRVIVEMVRCMLLDGDMPAAAWAEAVQTAVYIRNRAETSALESTPFEYMYGRVPKMGHIQRFGANVVALKKGQRSNKLVPKGDVWRFCGYAPNQKGYRLICTNSGKLIISRDCRFVDEQSAGVRVEDELARSVPVEEVFKDAEGTSLGPHEAIQRQVYDRNGKYNKCYRENDTDEEM